MANLEPRYSPQHPLTINQDRPMNARRRLRLPRWSIGTMLIFVGWCAVAVALNMRPRVYTFDFIPPSLDGSIYTTVHFGFPFDYAYSITLQHPSNPRPVYPWYWEKHGKIALAANIAIGMLAAVPLTWASSYLLRRITSWIASPGRKSPPDS